MTGVKVLIFQLTRRRGSQSLQRCRTI